MQEMKLNDYLVERDHILCQSARGIFCFLFGQK